MTDLLSPCRLLFEGMLLAVVLNYQYGANPDRRPPNPFPGQNPNANCDNLQWHCQVSVRHLNAPANLLSLACRAPSIVLDPPAYELNITANREQLQAFASLLCRTDR